MKSSGLCLAPAGTVFASAVSTHARPHGRCSPDCSHVGESVRVTGWVYETVCYNGAPDVCVCSSRYCNDWA